MIITIVCEVLGAPNNGTSIAAMNLISYLKKKGHEVRVVCPDEDKRGWEGYYILPKASMGALFDYMFKANKVVLPSFDENVMREAMNGADLVHVMLPLFISSKTAKMAHFMGIPLTAGFHAQAENLSCQLGLINWNYFNRRIYKWYDHNLFRWCDAIHYPTSFVRGLFEKAIHHNTSAYVISNGVSNEFKPMPSPKPEQYKDKFCILFTGRISAEKSHKVHIKAVQKSKYNERIQLFFAGDGPRKEKIIKYAKGRLANELNINFYSRQDLLKLINMMDLYCHPAEIEAEAISCIEAIACGKVPIIANSPRCATKAFAVDERSLFKVNDSKDLARKIDHFIEHPEEIKELSEKYLQKRLAFDHDTCMERMEKMMLDTIERCTVNGWYASKTLDRKAVSRF